MTHEFLYRENGYNIFDDFIRGQGNLLIIPFSVDGRLSSRYVEFVDDFNIFEHLPGRSQLGDLKQIHLEDENKDVIFACVESNNSTGYGVVRLVIFKIAEMFLEQHPRRIVIPSFGANDVYETEVFERLVVTAFIESGMETHITFLSKYHNKYHPIQPDFVNGETSAQIAFRYSMPKIIMYEWVREIIDYESFYYDLAIQKFNEFITYSKNTVGFYNELAQEFDHSGIVFQEFIRRFPEESEQFRVLKLCGELIAYCDRNAYKKKEWNLNKDFRTLAQSGIKQTQWVMNLLKFKASENTVEVLSPSIKNTFLFLMDPNRHLTMLSENHRQFVSHELWRNVYDKNAFEEYTFQVFKDYGITSSLPKNNGVLYSRILYAPEIKILWYPWTRPLPKQRINQQNIEVEERSPVDIINDTEQEVRIKHWKGLIHSDISSQTDHLGYRTYADVMAAFLTSPMTKPPLTIGIMAPWGKGKTNIMKFVEERLKQYRPISQNDEFDTDGKKTTYRSVINWLKKDADKIFSISPKDYPVVWFNAWKFQKNEQIWAGLANEIITQLVKHLRPIERQKFWLRLNLKRIDKDKIKKDIFLKYLKKITVPAILAIVGSLLGLLLKAYQDTFTTVVSPFISFGSIGVALAWGITALRNFKRESPEADISKYLHQPEYKDKLGYYNAVEEDLREALKLLSNKDKPPVIFIDDLDRCSPAAVTELIEAINLFISGDISSCYFVIGLDAQVVAASLDVTYDKLGMKTANMGKQHGSIGWYFLEKFIQLQFNLPEMQQRQTTRLLNHLFDVKEELTEEQIAERKELVSIYETIEGEIETIDDLEQIFSPEKNAIEERIAQFDPQLVERFQQKVISRAINSYEIVENELQTVVDSVSAYLNTSPRMVKRFANLFMFYRFLQYTETCKGISDMGLEILGDWVLIMVRWPQLVRSIQWDNEKDFLHGEDALSRAKDLEKMIGDAEDYTDWMKICGERTKDITWQSDRQLFKFMSDREDEELLVNAVSNGLW